MIQELEIRQYKSIRAVVLPLGPLNVLIGANASGKSNLIDALRLLSEAVNDDMETAVTRRGGMDEVLFLPAGGSPREFEISLSYFVPDRSVPNSRSDMSYRIRVGEREGRPGVALEELRIKQRRNEPGRKQVWFQARWGVGTARRDPQAGVNESFDTGDPGVLALRALGYLDAFPRLRALRQFIAGWRFLTVDPARIREPQRDRRELELAPDARNLANVLRTLEATDPDRHRRIQEDVQSLLSYVCQIETRVDHGRILLLLQERGLPRALESLSLSDGTLRTLAVVTALYTTPEHGLLCVEEPEHGLHPLLMGQLLELLRERCPAGGSQQMVITTHSPDLVDAAHPDEVRVVARDSIGATELERLNPSDYDRWQHDFRLGELWRLRQLGGVP